MKYSVLTFGCRVNQSDSLAVEEDFLAAGAEPTDSAAADVVIVNTCSVTASADQAARQAIRRIARLNPSAQIVVTGCYATRRPDEIEALPRVAAVVPNETKPQLISITRRLRSAVDEDGAVTSADRFGEGEGACGAPLAPGIAGRTAFTLRVQTGCGERCSYCIIPVTRGRPISTPASALLAEVRRVANAGFREIALTGVHLGSYGRDLRPPSCLFELLGELRDWAAGRNPLRAEPAVRFRLSSLEPMDCSPEIVDLVATSECFAPHFHLPLQHASDAMLRAMQRPYSRDYFRRLVDTIRTRLPHAAIGSDVIVGFPDESDDDFAELTAYLESCPLTHIHVFPYSDRPGTVAASMPGKVHGSVVRERAAIVRALGQRLTTRFRASQLGTMQTGLTIEDGSLVVTGNYLKVRVPPGHARNEWVRIVVTNTGDPILGKIV